MDAATIADLVSLGSAGAVIIVVIIFLKFQAARDQEWRNFFTALNQTVSLDAAKRLELTEAILKMTERILALVEVILKELQEHDAKVEDRISAAKKATLDAITRPRGEIRK